ncbi:MAG: DUF1353 domain-containing protein [Thiobacillaceae bacterium]|nr:DUF1353 domain-containing protein [Thiobacillaceae bacterium]
MPKKTPAGFTPYALSAKDRKALALKFSLGDELLSPAPVKTGRGAKGARAATAARAAVAERGFYPDFPVGRFEGEPTLVWIGADRFLHLPRPEAPFRFVRANGETIEPGRMFTDGGSIPRTLWSVPNLSPWTYGPAFLVHDWLFDLHHCGRSPYGFEEVRDIMLEGVRTLMETGVAPKSRLTFDLIYTGIDSPVARAIWNRPGCTLPS